jgi:sugar lactone lactonase YvrE
MKTLHRLALTSLLALAGLLAACGGSDSEPPPPIVGSATLGAAGGVVDGPDGVQLAVPADALAAPVTLRVARDDSGAPALEGLNALSPVYAVTPHGQAFDAGASFSIPLSAAQVPAGATPMLLKAEPGGQWRVMGNASTDPARLAADIDELSYFVLGTCSSTPTDVWTIGGVDCPSGHELRLTILDQQGTIVQVLRGPNGVQIPLWYVTDTPQTRTFMVWWTRPNGTNRSDEIAVFGTGASGVSAVFNSPWSSSRPPVVSLNRSANLPFTVTIDPAQVAGASGPNGKLLRVKATASYSTTAFRIGQGNIPVGFQFETDIPVLVRYTGALPAITQQPANVGVVEGQAANFTVAASGGTLSYQWSRRANGAAGFAAIAGATSAAYAIAATQLADDGAQFQVEVCAAPTRCITSNPATLAVTQAPVVPSFITSPSDLSVVAGQTASFSATANGVPLPQLKWQSAAAGSNNFADVAGIAACGVTAPPAGATSVAATCTVGPLAVGDSGQRYRAVATNAAVPAGVFSSFATVTVNPAPVAPAITQQPAPQTTTVGGSASFSVTATGTAPLNYTWQQSGTNLPSISGGFNAGGCSGTVTYSNGNATITLSGLSAGCNGVLVSVTVGNGINPNAVSNNAVLTVNAVTQGLSLLAGDIGGQGSLDGAGTDARVVLSPENGIAFDAAGNAYFSETVSGHLRRVTPAGVVTTIAGATTPLRNPAGVAIDGSGNLFVVERGIGRILRITPAGVQSEWLPQGSFSVPTSLAIDASDNLYVTSESGSRDGLISKISPAKAVSPFYAFASGEGIGAIVVAGDGSVYGAGGGTLYGTVVRITPAGVLSAIAGAAGQDGNVDGIGAAARFRSIGGLALVGGELFATDGNSQTVRRVTLATGAVVTVSGAASFPVVPRDGVGTAARYEYPGAIGAGPGGDLLIGDVSALRKLSPASSYLASTVAGKWLRTGTTDGDGAAASFNFVGDVALDAAGNAYIAGAGRIRKVTPGGTVSTLAVTPAYYLVMHPSGVLVAANQFAVWRVTTAGVVTLLAGDPAGQAHVDAPIGTDARFYQISGLAVDAAGNVFVSEGLSQTIRRISAAGAVTTIAGAVDQIGSADGVAADARFNGPVGLAVDASGNVFVSDSGNLTIRRITPAGQVSTVAGTPNTIGSVDGVGAAVRWRSPRKLAFEPSGNLLIGDGSTLRRMTPANAVTTVMGVDGQSAVRLGASPRLNVIGGLAVRPNGRVVLTSEAAVLEAVLP